MRFEEMTYIFSKTIRIPASAISVSSTFRAPSSLQPPLLFKICSPGFRLFSSGLGFISTVQCLLPSKLVVAPPLLWVPRRRRTYTAQHLASPSPILWSGSCFSVAPPSMPSITAQLLPPSLWRWMIELVTSCGDGHALWCSIVVYIVY
ncbi:uncharacterized protein LOC121258607 [Juglans microcarpa x Juglans regia]|uniref:uncharacterized protein LOC121258607 n=1 Tax=Juglans microcarpa x Juglans regia TaxID=2249226 RepID=UPI001B7F72DE|nr:uncharacterized protein LOC121258607 [Juglans microcarpa x Juglans regia]